MLYNTHKMVIVAILSIMKLMLRHVEKIALNFEREVEFSNAESYRNSSFVSEVSLLIYWLQSLSA